MNVDEASSEAERRAAKVKNISLRLLEVTSPQDVLALFEEEFITMSREESGMESAVDN